MNKFLRNKNSDTVKSNICIKNFVITIPNCTSRYTNIALQCTRGKIIKTVSADEDDILSKEIPIVTIEDHFDQESKFFVNKNTGAGYKKIFDVVVFGHNAQGKKVILGSASFDISPLLNGANTQIKLDLKKSKYKNSTIEFLATVGDQVQDQ